jgi:hypothetical protein
MNMRSFRTRNRRRARPLATKNLACRRPSRICTRIVIRRAPPRVLRAGMRSCCSLEDRSRTPVRTPSSAPFKSQSSKRKIDVFPELFGPTSRIRSRERSRRARRKPRRFSTSTPRKNGEPSGCACLRASARVSRRPLCMFDFRHEVVRVSTTTGAEPGYKQAGPTNVLAEPLPQAWRRGNRALNGAHGVGHLRALRRNLSQRCQTPLHGRPG